MIEYWLLFSSAFISSTLLPGGSEVLFIYYIKQDITLKWSFFLVVTVGNSLGSIVTYFLGYYLRFGQKELPLKHPKIYSFCKKWGETALLLSWLPVVGDVICLLSGWLRLPKMTSFICIIIGKICRYFLLMTWFLA
jgi:membrane protein YqaA with SNARE-associated domain